MASLQMIPLYEVRYNTNPYKMNPEASRTISRCSFCVQVVLRTHVYKMPAMQKPENVKGILADLLAWRNG